MNTFEQIYLLDLHGNSLKKERCPDGSEDKNVFDIRQGVAIGLFVKKTGLEKKVCHAETWGLRERKYDWLEEYDVSTTKWAEIRPSSPFYLFIPRDEELSERYQKFPAVTEIFPLNSLGVQTHRDGFAIDFDKNVLERRIRMLRDKNLPDEIIKKTFDLKSSGNWKLSPQRKLVMADEDWQQRINQILYRPFDVRWIFYHEAIVDRPRAEVMRHMMHENLALNAMRQTKMSAWKHAVVSNLMTPAVHVEIKDGSSLFPLYLYPEADKRDLFSDSSQSARKNPNLDPTLVPSLHETYHRQPSPEEIFYYVYAVIYAPNYRTKYTDFLKRDFPRIPFTKDPELFKKLADLGNKLVNLHQLESPELDKPICRFQGKGDNRVQKQAYNQEEKRIYINKTQYFEGVEPEVWEYQIGGYQVLDKWLKDRKKRILSTEEIKHYCRVVTTIFKTIEVQKQIDTLYPKVEKNLLDISLNKTRA